MDPTAALSSAYGPFAFGLVAVLLIIGAIVMAVVKVYAAVVAPVMKSNETIAASHATTAAAMLKATEAAERIVTVCEGNRTAPLDPRRG